MGQSESESEGQGWLWGEQAINEHRYIVIIKIEVNFGLWEIED